MIALLQAELIKLRTTRTFYALVGAALGLSLLLVVLVTLLSDYDEVGGSEDVFSPSFLNLFIMLLGAMGMTGEWRHRTITSTVLAAPNRTLLLAAKVLAFAAAGAVMALIVNVVAGLVGMVILMSKDSWDAGFGDVLDILWRNMVSAALLGAFGVCIGALLRNQVLAIIFLLVLFFIVESVVYELAPEVGRFGPTNAASSVMPSEFFEDEQLLDPGPAVLVSLGWIALTFAAGALTLRRRDLV